MKKYLLKIKWYLFLTIVGDLLETLSTSVMLYLPGYLVDHYTEGTQKMIGLIVLYLVFFVLYLFSAYFGNRMADYRRVKFEKTINKDYFNAVIEKDYEDYNQLSSAEYISMQANDITELCQNYISPLMAVIRNGIMIVRISIFMNNVVIDSFMNHLKDINKLIIFVAHNMNQYKDVFDQVYYLKDTREEK